MGRRAGAGAGAGVGDIAAMVDLVANLLRTALDIPAEISTAGQLYLASFKPVFASLVDAQPVFLGASAGQLLPVCQFQFELL